MNSISRKMFNYENCFWLLVALLVDHKIVRQYKFDNHRPGFNCLVADLQSFNQPEIVFEAVGGLFDRLQKMFQDAGS